MVLVLHGTLILRNVHVIVLGLQQIHATLRRFRQNVIRRVRVTFHQPLLVQHRHNFAAVPLGVLHAVEDEHVLLRLARAEDVRRLHQEVPGGVALWGVVDVVVGRREGLVVRGAEHGEVVAVPLLHPLGVHQEVGVVQIYVVLPDAVLQHGTHGLDQAGEGRPFRRLRPPAVLHHGVSANRDEQVHVGLG